MSFVFIERDDVIRSDFVGTDNGSEVIPAMAGPKERAAILHGQERIDDASGPNEDTCLS